MKLLKNSLIVLAAILFWPLGVIFVWVFTKWSIWIKIFLTLPILTVLFFMVLFMFPYMYIVQPFKVSGASMTPNLNNGEYFMVKKYDRTFNAGEIIVYDHPEDTSQSRLGRIIGLPGQTVEIKEGNVYINGKKINEPYLVSENKTNPLDEKYTKVGLREDEYYVLGDNREHSMDSRAVGPIKKNLIDGKYWVTYYTPAE